MMPSFLPLSPISQEHASLQMPTIDATGRVVLFGFQLTAAGGHGGGDPTVAFTLKGGGVQLSQLSCRPAPAPPPYVREKSPPDLEEPVADDEPAEFIFIEWSMSDILLVSLAGFMSLILLWRHRHELGRCCAYITGGYATRQTRELSVYDDERMAQPQARGLRGRYADEDAAPLRSTRSRDVEMTLESGRPAGRIID